MKRLIFLILAVFFLFFSACSHQHLFRFAWFSDTHISGTSSGEDDLRAAAQDIYQLGNIDFVIISGDITDLNIGNYLQKTKNVLDELNVPYHIIPGNHDTKWTDTGNQNFVDLWGADKFTFEWDGIRFIGLHQGPVLRMLDGHIAPQDLHWMDSVLTALPDKNQPIILVNHYPVDNSVDNYDRMLDLVKDYNVQLILHGHGHRNRVTDYCGIPGVMSRSTLRAREKVGGFTLVDVYSDSIYFSERTTGLETKGIWARLPFPNPAIDLDTTRIIRPDDSVNREENSPSISWLFESGNLITASPVQYEDRILIGDATGVMYCLSVESGKVIWHFDSGYPIYGTADASDGKVVFANARGDVYLLNTSDGSQIWAQQTGKAILSVPVIYGNFIYLGGGQDYTFYALHLETGAIAWTFADIAGYIETRPLIYKDLVVFGAWDQYLYALNKNTGQLMWKWADSRPNLMFSPAACWPVAADNKIFVVAPDRYMSTIDYKSGKTIWRSNKHKVRETIGISGDSKLVFARCMRDTLIAVSPRNDSFLPVWASDLGFGYDIASSMIAEKDGIVFFGTKNGLISAVDSREGRLKWQYKLGNTLINTIHPLDRDNIIISNFDGNVARLKAGTSR